MDLNVQGDLVTSNPLSFRNRIINGNFDIWQRGTSFSSIAAYTYTADRWLSDGAVTSVARSGTQNNVMTVVTQAGTGMAQRIETSGGGFLAGQTYTISGLVNASVANLTVTVTYRAGNTFKATIHTADVSSQLTAGSYSRFTTTLTLANAPTDFAGTDCIQVSFTSSVVNTINFQNVQFESGSSATPFERRPIGMELQLCQRYYWRWLFGVNPAYATLGVFAAETSTSAHMIVPLPVAMRTTPLPVVSGLFEWSGGPGTITLNASQAYTTLTTLALTVTTVNNTSLRAGYARRSNLSGDVEANAEL
jgi:hypothetical protein